MSIGYLNKGLSTRVLLEWLKNRQADIHKWLQIYEGTKELPLYSSVDIRDAGFKIAVVDTNLFPAGFNNLCEHGLDDSVKFFKQAILKRVPNCQNILIVAEEHTRNTWYLENIRILQTLIEKAGFKTRIATFLTVQPSFCENASVVELETATGQPVRIHCFNRILNKIKEHKENIDLIILNNDLSSGIPEILKNTNIPIYPSLQAGWHSRLKSHHFKFTAEIMTEFGKIVDMDPWLFSTKFNVADQVNINEDADRHKLADLASDLFKQIQKKYDEHQITEKPFIFVKSDSGTYGMAVMSVEDPSELINLNRKEKNKLYKGKSSIVVERYLLQEGVPTIHTIDHQTSEVCIYQIESNLIGGFYRSNSEKNDRQNLNSSGMDFKKMCPHLKKYGDCGVNHNMNIFDIYRILARIAGIAAHREVVQLEKQSK